MRRYLHHPLGWCLLLSGALVALLILLAPAPAGPAADKADRTPHVEPMQHKAYTEKMPISEVTFDMVPIPGGTFLMGSASGEKGRGGDEGPQHPVQIRPFWMGKCEVTWDEYDLFWTKEARAKERAHGKPEPTGVDALTQPTPAYGDPTFNHGHDHHPALCMAHHAAMEYCRWLSQKTGKHYRLPTEAEWEWAARAGTSSAYFFGDDPKKLEDYAWFADDDPDQLTQEVGQKKPNPWGLYDIYGNVSEWCLDQYRKDAYAQYPTDKLTLEPLVPPLAARFSNVVRGGSWADKADRCRSATRRGSDKAWIVRDPNQPQSIWWLTDADFVGFRIVRPLDDNDKLLEVRSPVTRQSPDYPK